jgi:hypothetical protein
MNVNEIPVGVVVRVVGESPFRGAVGYVEAAENPVPVMLLWGWWTPGAVYFISRANLELAERPSP